MFKGKLDQDKSRINELKIKVKFAYNYLVFLVRRIEYCVVLSPNFYV